MKRERSVSGHLLLGLGVVAVWLGSTDVRATLITDPNDPRSWQGATVGTFAQLYYGADTPANRQLIVDNEMLDDGLFNPGSFTSASLVATAWATTPGNGGCLGRSTDTTGTGDYGYVCDAPDLFTAANNVDNLWFQSSGTIGDTVYDMGFEASHAAVFNTIDHGPLPHEAIESTVYLSNDRVTWTQADVKRVWLEGYESNLGILWDGFVYVVGTDTGQNFRYASVIHGGPGALQHDGDNEINAIRGLRAVPEPSSLLILASGLFAVVRRRKA